jgi:ribosomal protein L11 methyltransferase
LRYIEIAARVPAADADAVCDALREAAGASPWIERPFTQRSLEDDATVDESAPVTVRAYVPADRAQGTAAAVDAALAAVSIRADVVTRAVDEEDWAESWKEHFHIERFGERIIVVPSWRSYEPRDGDVIIELDPGMAFGTGQHETTRMCLEALERVVRPGARVLDVGCGSGILAIAAAKLGAREVLAVDVDANCVRITEQNARTNGANSVVRAAEGSIGDAWPFEAPPAGFDVVVANIMARVIIEAAPALVGALASDGRTIVSGIIAEREAATVAALEEAGARVDAVRAMGEWRCIEAVRA